ncbi:phage head closure protein [Solibaculum mannosilyticum]|uniref:Head-tail adaptor protein n=1 Tax=Solibaculum mannosilyticum TaxID=2780922 RepID=A0A7I8D258_9FIRM|nr:phage head closure protein [Solibaculum mannosilyticum]BCI60846.1 hypothetical protein C12CBH8_14850 [Solibaculum mannosilyticum]
MMDDGLCSIYKVKNVAEKGNKPVKGLTKLVGPVCYEERTVGITRYYTAMQAHVRVDRVLRIWKNTEISSQDVCIPADGQQYTIQQIQHTTDDDGLPVSDLTLERLEVTYDVTRST